MAMTRFDRWADRNGAAEERREGAKEGAAMSAGRLPDSVWERPARRDRLVPNEQAAIFREQGAD